MHPLLLCICLIQFISELQILFKDLKGGDKVKQILF